jgi:hypothetical protein
MGRRIGTTRAPRPARLAVAAAAVTLLSLLVPVLAPPAHAGAARAPGRTVWLCRPGQRLDPCLYSRAATSVSATGATQAAPAAVPTQNAKKFDCFYVYPTVSTEQSLNADLKVQTAEVAAAISQVSRFSQVCNVWAPMYRQATVTALATGHFSDPSVIATAYNSLLAGWRDYLAHDNDGRPIVYIGHSQGSSMLIKLLRSQVDPSASRRAQLVSALILGGNVQVPQGARVGATFLHIPTCSSATQTGCVIAYSTFGSPPPSNALFGRAGQGVSQLSAQTTSTGQQVACVNPVTFSAAPGALLPYFAAGASKPKGVTVSTPWVSYPALYTATCESSRGATWLQVDTASAPGDPRPKVTPTLGPLWGYHVYDVNLALGDLVYDVAAQEAAYHH